MDQETEGSNPSSPASLLDLVGTGDRSGVDAAFEAFTALSGDASRVLSGLADDSAST